jgi:dihydrofolate synthase/folylpolyglutamate synthase
MTVPAIQAPAAPTKTEILLQRLWALHPKIIDLSLERIERLLAALGHPEEKLPPVVHVAGTNGKGSVVAFLRAFAEQSGRRAHVYTSPHLVRINERFRIAGRLATDDELFDLLSECEAANGGRPITFFEMTTAVAMLAFSRVPAEVAILETGLGGRLDATNVVHPAVTAITPVSIDHIQFLGSNLPEIAAEKAGILKPGVPAVIGPQPEEAARVIAARADAIGAPLLRFGAEWDASVTPSGMVYRDSAGQIALPAPGLAGAHQIANAGTAIACACRLFGEGLGRPAIAGGLARVEWPGRLQRLGYGPLIDMLGGRAKTGDIELWLDGGHNPGAAEVLAETARQWADRPLHLVFGMLATKDGLGFLRPLAPLVASCQTVTIPGEPATLTADEAAQIARQAGIAARPAATVGAAVAELARVSARGPARILICGSLYLAGHVLADNG